MLNQLLQWIGYNDSSITDALALRRKRTFILTSFFTGLILSIDIFQNLAAGFETLAYIETFVLPLIAINFFVYKRTKYYARIHEMLMALLLSFMILISLIIEGFGVQIMLFWIAVLPLILFLLLNLKCALIANAIVAIILALLTVNAYVDWLEPLFSIDIFIQLSFGYLLFSLLVYLIEQSRTEYEVQLISRDREREVLLKEVHHRVKNNLQLMMSLLGLQADSIEDPKYAKLFLDNIDRLSAMALVHESIYKAEDFEKINMQTYLQDIINHLQRITRHKIKTKIPPIRLEMKSAMNLGLILNEAVTNAIEHAYPDENEGTISITLDKKDKIVSMKIEDNGVGLIEGTNTENRLGMTLMDDLSHSLPEGKLQVTSLHGVTVRVQCKGEDSFA